MYASRYSDDVTQPLSVRFDRDVLERLRRHAAAVPGATPSGLAQRLVDEGLQRYRADHHISATWEARERVVVALTGGPEGETLIRAA